MEQEVVVLGSDGYIGHALTLRLLNRNFKVIGIDNGKRRNVVQNIMNSTSASNIEDSAIDRANKIKQIYPKYHFYEMDVLDYERLNHIFEEHNLPDTIFYLSHQPAAPFSHLNYEECFYTVENNIMSTINLIWMIKKLNPNTHLITIGSMGEYDPAVNVDIPEGLFSFNFNNRHSKQSIFPRRPGSFYHASKVSSTYFIDCACRFWKNICATDIMQGVVYGLWTPEIEKTQLNTRLDFDESFGTVVHRFIVQSLLQQPLTIYGQGQHSRGFLALNDSIQCLELAMDNRPEKGEYRSWNQLDQVFTMNEIADYVVQTIGGKKRYIESPRAEDVTNHYYNPIVDKLKRLGFEPTRDIIAEIKYISENIDKQRIQNFTNTVVPQINWR